MARSMPNAVNVRTIPAPYTKAVMRALLRLAPAWLVKYDTVIGIIGNTHGVSRDNAPMAAANHRKLRNDWCCGKLVGTIAVEEFGTLVGRADSALGADCCVTAKVETSSAAAGAGG
jgi:hypothetical protein